jgi:hypothetical protein
MKTVFYRNGKPFFPLGGQCHNANSQSPQELEVCWKALKELRANTAEIPIYWSLIEPEEGKFDFTQVDQILQAAREQGLHLILLWFATWKNGKMQYTPDWVKKNPSRFHRVKTHDGAYCAVLSPNCRANLEADKKAFAAVMEHLCKVDAEGTVIAMQVENEPGIDGRAMRDHGDEAEREYNAEVPVEISDLLPTLPESSPVYRAWKEAGGLKRGNWREMFGPRSAEYFSAWSIGRYINEIARTGKSIKKMPMIVNVWNGNGAPGLDYPAGGAVVGVLDLWKLASPDIDILGPDIYLQSPKQFSEICAAFDRPDNPMFIPESPRRKCNEWGIINAVGNHHAIGYFMFGVEDLLLEDGSVNPDFMSAVDSFRMTADAIPLIIENFGKFHTILQEEGMISQHLDLDGYTCNVHFAMAGKTDYRHRYASTRFERGRGYLFQTGKHEFFCVGDSFYLDFRKKPGNDTVDYAEYGLIRHARYLTVEEGHFDEDGKWIVDRVRTGDDLDFGVWMFADHRVVRVEFYE